MKKTLIITPFIFCILISCSKNDPTVKSNSSTNNNTSGNSTNYGNTGNLVMNISWSLPLPTNACTITSFIDVEISGSNTNYTQTYIQVSPIRIDKTLPIGTYSYTVKKRPNTNCFSFSTIVKSGSFTISTCPSNCGNSTSLSLVF